MKVSIKNVEYDFTYGGFGPLYTFETITGRAVDVRRVQDMHLLIYSTLLYGNRTSFRMGVEEFSQALYDDPDLEKVLTEEIVHAWERRAALSAEKKSE